MSSTIAYDPTKAAALLDEAGWKKGAGGLRRDATGDVLRLDLMTTAGDRTRELVEQVLQSGWRQLGIDAQIKNQPARVLFGQTLTHRRFTGMAMFAWISSPENPPRSTLHSEEIPSAANGWSGQNYGGYSDPEMDRLIDAIEVELDHDKRRALWVQLQQLYAEDLPALPLYFRAEPHVWPQLARGCRAHRADGPHHALDRALAGYRRRRLGRTAGSLCGRRRVSARGPSTPDRGPRPPHPSPSAA